MTMSNLIDKKVAAATLLEDGGAALQQRKGAPVAREIFTVLDKKSFGFVQRSEIFSILEACLKLDNSFLSEHFGHMPSRLSVAHFQLLLCDCVEGH